MSGQTPIEPRGVLNPRTGQQKFQLNLHPPSANIAPAVEYFWVVRWDLRGQEPYVSEVLSHPAVHLVIEQGNSRIYGVVTRKFRRAVEGCGWVFGIKFRPAAYYPFSQKPVSRLTDREIGLDEDFGADGLAFEAGILALEDEAAMVAAAERFLRARWPAHDETAALVGRVIDAIMTDGSIVKVDDLVARFNLSKRSLQRFFKQYVGVSPKWVIQRYRLHEAAEKLARGEVRDWTALALALGYFDQAHFIKDFKSIVGKTPGEYLRQL